jgi:2-methylisocitrate lyase-like PEP mutase family enzyme
VPFSGFLRLDRTGPVAEDEMNQAENAARFAGLHVKGAPLLLYNAWDAGSAKAIVEAGGKAIACRSHVRARYPR